MPNPARMIKAYEHASYTMNMIRSIINGGYTNIKNALEVVDSGNVVYVMPGTYVESIDFRGKKFKLF